MAELSIIVPVYNAADLGLDRCLQSIISQDYADFELILVNDGSTDNSLKICKQFARKDKRILIKDNQNAGVSSARNDGLAISSGKYITFIDSDDIIENGYLGNMMSHTGNTDLPICGIVQKFKNGNEKTYHVPNGIGNLSSPDDFHSLIKSRLVFGPCNKIFRADVIRKYNIRFPERINYGEDRLFCYNYLSHIKTFEGVTTTFYHYQIQSNNSLSNKYRPNLFDLEYDQWRNLVELYKLHDTLTYNAQKDLYIELFWMVNDALVELMKSKRLTYNNISHILSKDEIYSIRPYASELRINWFIKSAILNRRAICTFVYYKLLVICKR